MDEKKFTHAGPIEMLAEWEGPAVYEPGVLLEESQVEQLALGADAAAMAGWIAVTALSGVPGNNASQAIKNKVRGILAAWRQRHGQPKLDEVKQQLFQLLQAHRNNRKITDEDLRERIELLFREMS
jgi:hypothetical protein